MRIHGILSRSLLVCLFAFVLPVSSPMPCSAEEGAGFSPDFEYKEYIVRPGDTLWSIAKRELEDGFQWPIIWRENLRIGNPDQIEPGRIIIIPIRVIERAEITPDAVVIERDYTQEVSGTMEIDGPEDVPDVVDLPAGQGEKLEPIASRELLLASGYITRYLPDAGKVTGSPDGRFTFAQFDTIYIKTNRRASVGDKFYVVKKEARVKHPVHHKPIGFMAKVAGVLEVQEAGRKGLLAEVVESFEVIEPGDTLDYYYEISPPYLLGAPRRPQTTGHVVASNYMRTLNGTQDIIFIDKGRDHGLRMGDVLVTVKRGTDDRLSSVVQLVNLRKGTSLGVIIKSVSEVKPGDLYQGMR